MHTQNNPDNVILNKASVIEKCLKRVLYEHAHIESSSDYTHIDAMILNIERSCQAAIDIAMHLCAKNHYGIPQNSSQAFESLFSQNMISEKTKKAMKSMIGFRNIAVHDYQELEFDVIEWVASIGYRDFMEFLKELNVTIEV